MNAERLLELYEQISEAPDAIARLRRFVLDLAVRGKLVEQDPADEPAAELHRRLTAEFKDSKKPRGRGKRSEVAGIIAEPPFNLPSLWVWAKMGELGQTNIGLTYSPSNVDTTGIPVLRSNNVQNSRIDLTNLVRVDVTPKDSVMVSEGDMLICARNGSRALVGKAAIIRNLPEPMAFGAFMALFRSPINPYLHLFLASPVFRQVIDEVNTTTINQITQSNLRSTLVPLPPLAEQHRIVAKVEEFMALCDRLEEASKNREETRDKFTAATLARLTAPETATASETDDTTAPSSAAPNQTGPKNAATGSPSGKASGQTSDFRTHARFAIETLPALTSRPDQIKSLRQTILNLAVRGKLVEQDPADEPALHYLMGLDEVPSKTRKQLSPLSPSEFGDDFPQSWVWLSLGAIIRGMDAGWSPQCENRPRSNEDEWGVLKTTAVQTLAFDAMQHKLLPTKLKPRPQFQAEVGDILVTRAGPKNRVGISCVVDVPCPKLMISDKLIRFHAIGDLAPRYIALTLNAGLTLEQIEAAKSGMAVMQMNISQAKLRALPIPLPPVAEQHRIVAKVDALMAICDRLEAALTSADTTRTRLLETLLHEALEPSTDVLKAAE